eukprot:SAG31_NODE_15040_length_773_cov_2.094955_1_plen_101_part_00
MAILFAAHGDATCALTQRRCAAAARGGRRLGSAPLSTHSPLMRAPVLGRLTDGADDMLRPAPAKRRAEAKERRASIVRREGGRGEEGRRGDGGRGSGQKR